MFGQGPQHEGQKSVNIQGSRLVLLIELLVFPRVALTIHQATLDEELPP